MKTKKNNRKYRRVFYTLLPGERKEIALSSEFDDSSIAEFKKLLQVLVKSKRYDTPITVREWQRIEALPIAMRQQLVKHKLIEPTQDEKIPKLGDFLDEFRGTLRIRKNGTLLYHDRIRSYLVEYYGEDKRIDCVTPADAMKHCIWLVSQRNEDSKEKNLGSCTIYQAIKRFRTIFNFAIKCRYISDNPYTDVHMGQPSNKNKFRRVPMDDIYRVIEACRGDAPEELRLIIILSRVSGVRIPSEINEMKFNDFEGHRYFRINEAGKTGHRVVPFFEEIIPYFEAVKAKAAPGQEYVFEYYRKHKSVGRGLERAVKKAGVTPWPGDFVQLRSNAITDKREAGWRNEIMTAVFGNSVKVREEYYIQEMPLDDYIDYCKPLSNKTSSGELNCGQNSIISDTILDTIIKQFSVDSSVVFYEAFKSLHPSTQAFYAQEYGDADLNSMNEFLVELASYRSYSNSSERSSRSVFEKQETKKAPQEGLENEENRSGRI